MTLIFEFYLAKKFKKFNLNSAMAQHRSLRFLLLVFISFETFWNTLAINEADSESKVLPWFNHCCLGANLNCLAKGNASSLTSGLKHPPYYCDDCSRITPCCGIGSCNIFCCQCDGGCRKPQ